MASSCVSCRLRGLLVLAAVVAVLATEEASADDCGQSAVCRERTEKLRVMQAERHDLQRRLDDAENTQCEPQVTAAKSIDLGQGEADVGGDVSEIVSAMGPACTALHCPVDGYRNAGEAFSNQLSEQIGQKTDVGLTDPGSQNVNKVIAVMENLVEADGMVSAFPGGLQFQMNFESNVGNTFRVTGCNSPTGTTCSSDNLFQTNAGTGGWGGSCTCPDGSVYQVGDNSDSCGSLACVGGTSGQCNQAGGDWSGNKVSCAAEPAAGKNCAMEVTTSFQACPQSQHSQVSECSKCVHGNGLLAQSVQLLTDIPACHTWFVKADAVIRSITTHMRTFWLTDRINLCKDA